MAEQTEQDYLRELQKKDPAKLTRAEKKVLRADYIKREDAKYKENEIQFGLRTKVLILVISLLSGTVLTSYLIATNRQTASLEQQLVEKGEIIAKSVAISTRAKFAEAGIFLDDKHKKLKKKKQLKKFYKELELNALIFEFIASQVTIPDLVYVAVLGKKNIVWGEMHTKKNLEDRKIMLQGTVADTYRPFQYKYQPNVKNYFEMHSEREVEGVPSIVQEFESAFFNSEKKIEAESKWESEEAQIKGDTENIIDISIPMLMSPKDQDINNAIGEIHVGISKSTAEDQIFDTVFDLSLASFISLLVAAILSVIAATYLAKPIQLMTEGMQKVIKGDFSAAVTLKSKDEIGALSTVFNRMLGGMSILVSPEVANVVMNTEDLYSNSEQRDVTVLFSDIRGFTTLSESMTPREVVEMLNDYLDLMTNIIVKYGGVVDKFVGDEIFSVFGAPFDHPNHPLAACAVALEMGAVLAAHNKERVDAGKHPIDIGIGINTGPVISGSMGSKKRVDYTSIGDAVNLGARLEGTNKVYGTLIIMSEFTYALVSDWVIGRELDSIRVKGKNEPVVIFEVMDLTEEGEALAHEIIETAQTKKSIADEPDIPTEEAVEADEESAENAAEATADENAAQEAAEPESAEEAPGTRNGDSAATGNGDSAPEAAETAGEETPAAT